MDDRQRCQRCGAPYEAVELPRYCDPCLRLVIRDRIASGQAPSGPLDYRQARPITD